LYIKQCWLVHWSSFAAVKEFWALCDNECVLSQPLSRYGDHLLLRDFRFMGQYCKSFHGNAVRDLSFLNATLWKQCTETKNCSLINGLLCAHTSPQHAKTYVYMLMLCSFHNGNMQYFEDGNINLLRYYVKYL
jgi:hypothetical protein